MNALKGALKFLGFWFLVMVSMTAASMASGIRQYINFTPEQVKTAGMALPVVTLCYAAVFALITSASAWRGLKLFGAMFLAFFGINGFLAQIETLVFLQQLTSHVPAEALPRIVATSAMTAALASFFAMLVYGKLTGKEEKNPDAAWLNMPAMEWLWKLIAAGIAYMLIYFIFGALVAKPLAGADFERYYGKLKLPWWMPFFQIARGCVWTGIAVPVLMLMKGNRVKSGFVVALMFAVFIGIALLTPNPFMTDGMRFGHLIELLTSNFVNGWAVYLILSVKRKSAEPLMQTAQVDPG